MSLKELFHSCSCIVTEQGSLVHLESYLGASFTFISLPDFIDLFRHLEEELVEKIWRLGHNPFLAMRFVLLEHLLQRLELTMFNERCKSHVHVGNIKSRAL